jgi:hypothetical protein
MFGFFDHHHHAMGNQQQQQSSANIPPPASAKSISSLPMVKVTSDDLLEETNKECVVCLDDQRLGTMACKLPCGHLFHKKCVTEWLQKKCTCPVCRYELETSDLTYEAQRRVRMKKRKLRMRMDEIKSKPVAQLRVIASEHNVSIAGCIDKKEIIDALLAAHVIDLIERLPPIVMTEGDFNGKSVAQLRHLLLRFGLSDEGALEKRDLRNVLLQSGRINIVQALSAEEESKPAEDKLSTPSPGSSRSGVTLSALQAMSLSTLRQLCQEHSINTAKCLYKSDIIECIHTSGKVSIVEEAEPDHPGHLLYTLALASVVPDASLADEQMR